MLLSGILARRRSAAGSTSAGRGVLMTAGSVAATLLVLALSQVTTLLQFYVLWALIGVVMSAVLYRAGLRGGDGLVRAAADARDHRRDADGRLRQHDLPARRELADRSSRAGGWRW